MIPAIFLLGGWRIVYGIYQIIAIRKKSIFYIAGVLFIRIAIVSMFMVLFIRAALIIYLSLSLIKTLIYTLRRSKEFPPKIRILNLSVFIILIIIVAFSYIQKSLIDPIERIKKYTLSGTVPERKLVIKIASDPTFDIRTLIPLMEKHGSRDEGLAFQILYCRKHPNDLKDLKEYILNHPDLEKALSEDRWTDQMYLRFWLRSIGVEDSVKTKEDINDWIENKNQ
jgi:hypothetical protein